MNEERDSKGDIIMYEEKYSEEEYSEEKYSEEEYSEEKLILCGGEGNIKMNKNFIRDIDVVSYSSSNIQQSLDSGFDPNIRNRFNQTLFQQFGNIDFNIYHILNSPKIKYNDHFHFYPKLNIVNSVNIGSEIGRGGYGVVYDIVGTNQVIKMWQNRCLDNDMIKEINNLSRIKHPCIVSLEKVYLGENECGLIFNKGEQNSHYNVTKEFFYHILCGISFIHSLNIGHLDLKFGNTLKFGNQYRIADLGVSTGHCQLFHRPERGTPGFKAQEIENREFYDMSVDIYAFGIMMDRYERVGNPKFPVVLKEKSLADKGMRASAWDLLQHNFWNDVKKYEWEYRLQSCEDSLQLREIYVVSPPINITNGIYSILNPDYRDGKTMMDMFYKAIVIYTILSETFNKPDRVLIKESINILNDRATPEYITAINFEIDFTTPEDYSSVFGKKFDIIETQNRIGNVILHTPPGTLLNPRLIYEQAIK